MIQRLGKNVLMVIEVMASDGATAALGALQSESY